METKVVWSQMGGFVSHALSIFLFFRVRIIDQKNDMIGLVYHYDNYSFIHKFKFINSFINLLNTLYSIATHIALFEGN